MRASWSSVTPTAASSSFRQIFCLATSSWGLEADGTATQCYCNRKPYLRAPASRPCSLPGRSFLSVRNGRMVGWHPVLVCVADMLNLLLTSCADAGAEECSWSLVTAFAPTVLHLCGSPSVVYRRTMGSTNSCQSPTLCCPRQTNAMG